MISWFFRNRVFLFLWATITGFLFALVWKQYEHTIHQTLTYYRITPSSFDYQWSYKFWLNNQGLRSVSVQRINVSDAPLSEVMTEDKWLTKEVPVLCVILAKKNNKQSKAIKNTWSKHCNRALFYGSFNDDAIPVNKIQSKDSWDFLCRVLFNAWDGYREDFKWVLVVSDRTYAIVENLRYMVASLDSNDSLYLGHVFRDYDGQYNVEDAGYALSWGALAAFRDKFATVEACARAEKWQSNDRTLGKVLEDLGIKPKDTRDIMERGRFLPFNLDKLLIPGAISVFSRYWRESVFLSPEGSGCCSDFVVTFSDVAHDKMYMMEYVIYHLKPVSSSWPPVEDNGVPSKLEPRVTKSPAAVSNKAVGKASVSEVTGKRESQSKASQERSPSAKEKVQAVVSSNGQTVAKTELGGQSSKKEEAYTASNGKRIKNGHMEHDDDVEDGIGMNDYDNEVLRDDYPSNGKAVMDEANSIGFAGDNNNILSGVLVPVN